jgi:hypothetical protein
METRQYFFKKTFSPFPPTPIDFSRQTKSQKSRNPCTEAYRHPPNQNNLRKITDFSAKTFHPKLPNSPANFLTDDDLQGSLDNSIDWPQPSKSLIATG